MAKDLGELLVAQKAISASALARARQRAKVTGRHLGDCLVEVNAIKEKALLELIAKRAGVRFTTSRAVSELKVPPAALERLPVRFAEKHAVAPISLDAERGVLAVLTPEPTEERRAAIAAAARVSEVVAVVALNRVVQAAIRRSYYGDPTAFGTNGEPEATSFACPSCKARVSTQDFQCPRCELLLNAGAAEVPEVTEVSLVRGLLESPRAKPGAQPPKAANPFEEAATVAVAPPKADAIPVVNGGVDLRANPVSPFEAFVAAYSDGVLTVAEIAEKVGLSPFEGRVVFQTVAAAGLVRWAPPPAAKPPPLPPQAKARPTPPPPPVPAPSPPEALGNLKVIAAGAAGNKSVVLSMQILKQAHELERTGRVDEAIKVLERGLGRVRDAGMLYNRLALCLINRKRDYLRAEGLLEKALELEPDNDVYRQNLIKVLMLRGG